MGLPVMSVIFVSAAKKTVMRSDRGVVGMIVKDAAPTENPVTIYKEKDIPSTLSEGTKEQIALALKGNDYAPSKVVVYVLGSSATSYQAALDYFSLKKVNWLCAPTIATDELKDEVTDWVKAQRKERNKVKAVLPETEADDEGIVNFATHSVNTGTKTYTAEEYCARIAGLLAGTRSKHGATYAVLGEVAGCTTMDRDTLDKNIDTGKFLLYYDGEKVKVARAVNSLTTISETKAEPWKKIKVVETMDMVHDDLVLLVEDYYIGKYTNTFDNKCLLLSAIKDYLDEIARSGLIQDYEADFDVESIREYLIEHKGLNRDDAEAMSEAELKKQYTDEKVFFKAYLTVVDVMEDITLNVTV